MEEGRERKMGGRGGEVRGIEREVRVVRVVERGKRERGEKG